MSAARGCLHRFYRLDKDQIGYVKFVVEAYEGIAQVTSRAGRGEMEWIIPHEMAGQAEALALALGEEVGLVEIEAPVKET